MRTTTDNPDGPLCRLKTAAAETNPNARKRSNRIRLPIVRSKRPGTLRLTNQRVYEIIPFP